MSRSLKKGPYIDFKLERKVLVMNETTKKWADREPKTDNKQTKYN